MARAKRHVFGAGLAKNKAYLVSLDRVAIECAGRAHNRLLWQRELHRYIMNLYV
jgi:hypothetical protein